MGNELPKGWKEVPLFDIAELSTGKVDANHSTEDGLYPFYTCASEPMKSPDFSFDDEAVIVPGNGANVGSVLYYNGKFQAYQRTYVLSKIRIHPKYLYYHFLRYWKERTENKQFGSATNYVKLVNFSTYLVGIPSLDEQKQIAEKLDKLFDQIESIKKSTERIPELLKNFRQQILTYAVTGKLTEDWRKDKHLDEWRVELAKDCCEKVQSGGTPKGSKFETVGIPFLKVYNIVNNKIDFESEPQYVSEEIQNSQIKKSITYPGDVIMNIVGPPLNKVAIIPDTYKEWNLNQAITLFRPKEYLNNKYLYYFFCEGSSVNSVIDKTRGVVGQVNISLSQCRDFSISIPPMEEQLEIVKRIEVLFNILDDAERRYQLLCDKLDKFPQALLCKAFKGS